MDKVIFSICIPAYNSSNYLQSCLTSISKQVFSNWEVIVVDDASTDDTHDYIEHQNIISKQQIQYIQLEHNVGPYRARKIAIEHSVGQYILFMDADDEFVNSTVLSELNNIIAKKQYDLVLFNMCKNFETKKPIIDYPALFDSSHNYTSDELILIFTGCNELNNVWTKLFRRNVLINQYNIEYNQLKLCEDRLQVFEALLKVNSFYIYDEVLYFYRTVPTSTTHKKLDLDLVNQVSFVESTICSLMTSHNLNIYRLCTNFINSWAHITFTFNNIDDLCSLADNSFFRYCYNLTCRSRKKYQRFDIRICAYLLYYRNIHILKYFLIVRQLISKLFHLFK